MEKLPFKPLFTPGEVIVWPEAKKLLYRNKMILEQLLDDHSKGHWGEVLMDIWRANNRSNQCGGLIFSVFSLDAIEDRVMVLTPPDRSKTLSCRFAVEVVGERRRNELAQLVRRH